jgi:hypothetical protein
MQLVIASGLSPGTVNKTCRRKIDPNQQSKNDIVNGINKLLVERSIAKVYTVHQVFSPSEFGKID